MKAISIRQPWASLIVLGIKDIENRSWPTSQRGIVLVHASKGMTRSEHEDAVAGRHVHLGKVAAVRTCCEGDIAQDKEQPK